MLIHPEFQSSEAEFYLQLLKQVSTRSKLMLNNQYLKLI